MVSKVILGNSQTEKKKKKKKIVCASVFEIGYSGPGRDQNNLPYTVKINGRPVYIHIIFGHLFNKSVKMVYWTTTEGN